MRGLKEKIKRLDWAMKINRAKIKCESHLLKKSLHSPLLIALEIGGSFLTGYLLARKKSIPRMIGTLLALGISLQKIRKLKKHIKSLSL